MNPNDPTSENEDLPAVASDEPEQPPAQNPWLALAKRLLLCNPFYLCSAGLLLYAINRLSVDPGFLSDETQNLLFNFSALEIYELMLVGTAIVLAARRVWYDSALLVVLENGLVLMPFMLISHATFIDNRLGWTLTLVAASAAIGRVYAIRRFYPEFRMPLGALFVGSVVLLFNAALPHFFRWWWWVKDDLEAWRQPSTALWYAALPLLVAGANFLPRPTQYGGPNPERSWLPLFNYGLWIVGSGVHLWCLNYITRVPLQWVLVAPTVCACVWTVFNRLSDCLPNPPPTLRKAVLLAAFLAPLLAMQDALVFACITALNTVAFVIQYRYAEPAIRRTAGELALFSASMMFAGLPLNWSALNREEHIVGAAVLYCILLALRLPDFRIGLLGALALGAGVGWLVRDWTLHAAVQASCAFLLMHSLRWKKGGYAGDLIRFAVAIIWMLDAILWTRNGTLAASSYAGMGAIVVIVCWIWQFRKSGVAPPLVIPFAAALTIATGPSNWFYSSAPAGIIALAGSLVLFGTGTLIAWYRNTIVSE